MSITRRVTEFSRQVLDVLLAISLLPVPGFAGSFGSSPERSPAPNATAAASTPQQPCPTQAECDRLGRLAKEAADKAAEAQAEVDRLAALVATYEKLYEMTAETLGRQRQTSMGFEELGNKKEAEKIWEETKQTEKALKELGATLTELRGKLAKARANAEAKAKAAADAQKAYEDCLKKIAKCQPESMEATPPDFVLNRGLPKIEIKIRPIVPSSGGAPTDYAIGTVMPAQDQDCPECKPDYDKWQEAEAEAHRLFEAYYSASKDYARKWGDASRLHSEDKKYDPDTDPGVREAREGEHQPYEAYKSARTAADKLEVAYRACLLKCRLKHQLASAPTAYFVGTAMPAEGQDCPQCKPEYDKWVQAKVLADFLESQAPRIRDLGLVPMRPGDRFVSYASVEARLAEMTARLAYQACLAQCRENRAYKAGLGGPGVPAKSGDKMPVHNDAKPGDKSGCIGPNCAPGAGVQSQTTLQEQVEEQGRKGRGVIWQGALTQDQAQVIGKKLRGAADAWDAPAKKLEGFLQKNGDQLTPQQQEAYRRTADFGHGMADGFVQIANNVESGGAAFVGAPFLSADHKIQFGPLHLARISHNK